MTDRTPELPGSSEAVPAYSKNEHGSPEAGAIPPPLKPPPALPLPQPPPAPLPPQPRLVPAEIRRALSLLCEPNQLVEVRILDAVPTSGWQKARTFAGYFHACEGESVVRALQAFESWGGVFVTLNPLDEALYARSASRVREAKTTAQDSDVTSRHLILLDFDSVRPSGVSSTDSEHEMAIERARAARRFLSDEQGWPEAVLASSGNGAHLNYSVSLLPDDDIVRRVLESLDALFSDAEVVVDTCVHNAGRISKLYGTLACKGDSIPDRPHRVAQVIEAPAALEKVSREKLEELVEFAEAKKSERIVEAPSTVDAASTAVRSAPFDVSAFVQHAGFDVAREEPWKGGMKWVLGRCPMVDSHEVDKAAWIVQLPSGAVAAGCHHSRCTWGWRELRNKYELRGTTDLPRCPSPTLSGLTSGSLIVPGARVQAHDRENIGTVVDVAGGTATVHFVSPRGTQATKELPVASLTAIASGAQGDPAQLREYVLLGFDEALAGEWPEFLVDGLLDRRELAVLYGEPASFKSFLALDLALRVAIGVDWHMHATKESSVLYVAGEGQIGLRTRMSAWLRHLNRGLEQGAASDPDRLNETLRKRFFAIGSAVPLIDPLEPSNLLGQLEGAIDRLGELPALIVLDTLARCFLGGDENSSRDMGRFVDACDLIRKATGAAVLVIHHTGKNGDLERGSSALRAGADAMIKVSREERDGVEGAARVAMEKRKDGPHAGDLVFDMQLVELDPRPDGRPLSSLVPVPSATPAAAETCGGGRRGWRGRRRGRATAQVQRIALLTSLASTFLRKGSSATNLLADADVPRSSGYKRLNELAEEGHVSIHEARGADVYAITDAGADWLSRQSPVSQRLQVSETNGLSSVSRQSLPPRKGGRDDTETETPRDDAGAPEGAGESQSRNGVNGDGVAPSREVDA